MAARAPRRETLVMALVLVGCAAATTLLLAGWTPGPSGAAAQVAPAAAIAPVTSAPKPKPRATRKARPRRNSASAENSGLAIFSSECGVCHTLKAAGTSGRAGPNLDRLHPSVARVVLAIKSGGKGSGLMPPNELVGADMIRVARFVARSARR